MIFKKINLVKQSISIFKSKNVLNSVISCVKLGCSLFLFICMCDFFSSAFMNVVIIFFYSFFAAYLCFFLIMISNKKVHFSIMSRINYHTFQLLLLFENCDYNLNRYKVGISKESELFFCPNALLIPPSLPLPNNSTTCDVKKFGYSLISLQIFKLTQNLG